MSGVFRRSDIHTESQESGDSERLLYEENSELHEFR